MSPSGVPAEEPFSVLVVCTANICRSPVAEGLLRAALGPSSGVEVSSAGLRARVGEPMAPGMAVLMDHPPEGFAARQLGPALVGAADLVLTMTRDHRAAVVGVVPGAVRRTFTLREFAALTDLVGSELALSPAPAGARLAALTAVAPRFRSRRTAGDHDDVDDPYGLGPAAYERSLTEIAAAVDAVVTVALGVPAADLH